MSSADFSVLPEGCIANILSLTTPADASRLSLVSSTFLSAANSDAVWERFLPSDCHSIVSQSNIPQLVNLSKKQLYFHLCDEPILIEGSKKSFVLDKWSGKKCYMVAARGLNIVWGDTPTYWEWISLSESRFDEVAVLHDVCWLEIHGKINTSMLSLNTNYAAYLVFKLSPYPYFFGFEGQPVDVSVGIIEGERRKENVFLYPKGTGGHRQFLDPSMFLDPDEEEMGPEAEEIDGQFQEKEEVDEKYLAENVFLNFEGEEMDGQFPAQNVFQNPEGEEMNGQFQEKKEEDEEFPLENVFLNSEGEEMDGQFPAQYMFQNPVGEEVDGKFAERRRDGWLEIELGEYFIGEDDGELEMSLKEVDSGNWKSGLIIQGIEVRPRV